MLRIKKQMLLLLFLLFIVFNQSSKIQAEVVNQFGNSSEKNIDSEESSQVDQEKEEIGDQLSEELRTPIIEKAEEITDLKDSLESEESVAKPAEVPIYKEVFKNDAVEEEFTERNGIWEEPQKTESSTEHLDDVAQPKEQVKEEEKNKEESKEVIPLNSEPFAGLIDVGLLTNTKLTATRVATPDGKEKIILKYRGYGLLNVRLLGDTYTIFQLPPEIARLTSNNNIKASYDVPAVGLLGIEIRNEGDFRNRDISIADNQVVLNFKQFLSLILLSNSSYYEFTLEITLDELPETQDGLYRFKAEATKQIVDISILSGNVATASLGAPQVERVLGFQTIPQTLPFKTTKMDSKPMTIKRQDPNWAIEVKDTRGENSSWKMTAEATQPLTATTHSLHSLPDALVYVDEQNNKNSLSKGAVEVFSGGGNTEPITTVRWTPNTGPLIHVIPTDAYAETYSTTITWTLLDAP